MKRLAAKIDEYTDAEGKTKGKYIDIGVIMENQHGEYAIINPTVDLAGVMIRQRMLDPQKGGKGVMCSVFDNNQQQGQPSQHEQQKSNGYQPQDSDVPF